MSTTLTAATLPKIKEVMSGVVVEGKTPPLVSNPPREIRHNSKVGLLRTIASPHELHKRKDGEITGERLRVSVGNLEERQPQDPITAQGLLNKLNMNKKLPLTLSTLLPLAQPTYISFRSNSNDKEANRIAQSFIIPPVSKKDKSPTNSERPKDLFTSNLQYKDCRL